MGDALAISGCDFTRPGDAGMRLTAHLIPQRQLHDMYQSYFEEDPRSRTPPIPTAFLNAPGSRTGKCWLFGSSPACVIAW